METAVIKKDSASLNIVKISHHESVLFLSGKMTSAPFSKVRMNRNGVGFKSPIC